MDLFSDGPDESLGRVCRHVATLSDVFRAAAALLTVGEDAARDATPPESALRSVAVRAFLTEEWGASVDARLSEACTVLGLSATYARALSGAGIGAWLGNVWAEWGMSASPIVAPQLFDPRVSASTTRQAGIPVLPFDVVDAVSAWLAQRDVGATPRVLDVSAGTGSMIASLLTKLLAGGRRSADGLLEGMRMVEADRERLDVACIVVARVLEGSSIQPPAEVLRRVRAAVVEGDAVDWSAGTAEKYDLVVGTTPLAPGDDSGARPGSPDQDRSADYARVLCDRVADGGFGSLIALAAVVTSPVGAVGEARDRLLERFRTIEFLTFDHAPVPLLGSADGASRTIVRGGTAGIGTVTTTPVMRCSRAGREVALADAPSTTLHQTPPLGPYSFVPRIGSDIERRLVDAVIVHAAARWKGFRVQLTHGDHRGGDDHFSVGATARDAFSVALREPRVYFGERPTASARFGVRPLEPELGDAAVAVLVSRTAFWWWTASGDGLHVRREHITEPLSWLRLLTPEEVELGGRVAAAWCAVALAASGEGPGASLPGAHIAERTSLTRAFDEVLLSHLGATESGAREFLAMTSRLSA